jgi:pilus assembly protein TadC
MGVLGRAAAAVRRIFPKKFLDSTERRLRSTNIALAAEEYIGIALLVIVGICVAISVIGVVVILPIPTPLLVLLIVLVMFPALTIGIPYYLAQRRAAELERLLPDALRQIASTLRAGIGIDAALEDIAKLKYGALSQEFERTVMEIRKGRQLNSALLALAHRSNSPLFERAFGLIVEGIERGAALADVLDAVSADIREVHTIQRERKTATTQQVLFLVATALIAAPLIMGLTIAIGEGLMKMSAKAILPDGMSGVVLLFVIIQAVISSLAIGVIRYGRMMRGGTFIVPFVIVAIFMFYVARFFVSFIA